MAKVFTREADYQAYLINCIPKIIEDDKVLILKNDSSYLQGIPDLSVMSHGRVALLEVKLHSYSKHQPNQDYYVTRQNQCGGFARFIHQENEKEILDELKNYFKN